MSVSLLLVPAVIAAVAGSTAAGAAGAIGALASGSAAQSDRSLIVATRMRDLGLLSQAVVDIHGTVAVADDEHLSAIVSDLRLDMTRGADGIWAAHIDAARTVDVDEANALMLALDRAYLARVQQAVAERIRQNADAAGFHVISDTVEADASVRLVLQATTSVGGS